MALLAVLFGTSASPQPTPRAVFYPPTDEAVLEPELFATRAAVLMALQAKDWQALRYWITPCEPYEVRCADADSLPSSDRRTADLMVLLTYGGRFVRPARSSFCAPYWINDGDWIANASPPRTRLQPEGLFAIVIEPEAVIRAQPAPDAAIVRRLTLEVLGTPDGHYAGTEEYSLVGLGALRGYVKRSALQGIEGEPPDSACFERKGNSWRLSKVSVRADE
jgi:hypothetical protein